MHQRHERDEFASVDEEGERPFGGNIERPPRAVLIDDLDGTLEGACSRREARRAGYGLKLRACGWTSMRGASAIDGHSGAQVVGCTRSGTMNIKISDITGLILAGGRGSRMGGVDKGLQDHLGVPLALHALRRLAPQVGTVMINANRNLDVYASMGVPVWPDEIPDYAGPLAGMLAGLAHCETPYLATVPCDTPNFPLIWSSSSVAVSPKSKARWRWLSLAKAERRAASRCSV